MNDYPNLETDLVLKKEPVTLKPILLKPEYEYVVDIGCICFKIKAENAISVLWYLIQQTVNIKLYDEQWIQGWAWRQEKDLVIANFRDEVETRIYKEEDNINIEEARKRFECVKRLNR